MSRGSSAASSGSARRRPRCAASSSRRSTPCARRRRQEHHHRAASRGGRAAHPRRERHSAGVLEPAVERHQVHARRAASWPSRWRIRRDDVVLTVRDSGVGISADFLPHIFDRFSQADGSAGRRHGGLGLGMAIVRHLVELHGGTVRAESAGEGKGATFITVLPRRRAVDIADAGPDPESPVRAPVAVHASAAEPGRTPRARGRRRSRQSGVSRSPAAAGGRGGVAGRLRTGGARAARHTEVSVIVSDLEMSEREGLHLIRTLRGRADTADLPAIALTGHLRAEQVNAALDAGYDLQVAKPVDVVQLATAIDALAGIHDTPDHTKHHHQSSSRGPPARAAHRATSRRAPSRAEHQPASTSVGQCTPR